MPEVPADKTAIVAVSRPRRCAGRGLDGVYLRFRALPGTQNCRWGIGRNAGPQAVRPAPASGVAAFVHRLPAPGGISAGGRHGATVGARVGRQTAGRCGGVRGRRGTLRYQPAIRAPRRGRRPGPRNSRRHWGPTCHHVGIRRAGRNRRRHGGTRFGVANRSNLNGLDPCGSGGREWRPGCLVARPRNRSVAGPTTFHHQTVSLPWPT